jgi:hypothetical protein
VISLLLLFACTADPVAPSPAAPDPASTAGASAGASGPKAPTVPTLLGDVPGVAFVGDWTSPGCAGRTFARNLRFESDNSYAGVDLVSPCPPDTECVWSGLVGYAGIWKQEGNKLQLREIGAPTAPGSPHPTEVISTFDGTLMENGCTYTKGLAVPPGMTEEQVRPRIPR